jgi:hypothetical protein
MCRPALSVGRHTQGCPTTKPENASRSGGTALSSSPSTEFGNSCFRPSSYPVTEVSLVFSLGILPSTHGTSVATAEGSDGDASGLTSLKLSRTPHYHHCNPSLKRRQKFLHVTSFRKEDLFLSNALTLTCRLSLICLLDDCLYSMQFWTMTTFWRRGDEYRNECVSLVFIVTITSNNALAVALSSFETTLTSCSFQLARDEPSIHACLDGRGSESNRQGTRRFHAEVTSRTSDASQATGANATST